MKPQAGGEYVYIRDAYGPLPGFLYAWTWFAIAKPASIATLTTGFVRILGTFPALAFFNQDAVSSPFAISYGQLVAIAAAVFITALNYIGVKRAGEFQVIFTVVKDRDHSFDRCCCASASPAAHGATSPPASKALLEASRDLWQR